MGRMTILAAASGLIFGTMAACTPAQNDQETPKNSAPQAAMTWPQIWAVDEPLPVDLRASVDEDDDLAEFQVTFGDGTPARKQSHGRFEHLYPYPGTFALEARVVDRAGQAAVVRGSVVMVRRMESPLCSCEQPCFSPGVCSEMGCFLNEYSDDEFAATFPALVPTAMTGEAVVCAGSDVNGEADPDNQPGDGTPGDGDIVDDNGVPDPDVGPGPDPEQPPPDTDGDNTGDDTMDPNLDGDAADAGP